MLEISKYVKNAKIDMTSENGNVANEMRQCFENQLNLLKMLLKQKFENERLHSLRIVPASSCSTGAAICDLGKHPEYYFAEMVMLARSFIEKTTNYCYLILCDEDEYRNYITHPYYRMFHNLDREKSAGNLKLSLRMEGRERLKTHPQIAEALARFSETNPKKNWSEKSIDQKVLLIHKRSKVRVEFYLMNTLTIYSNASEALHGSLYGSAFHLGTFEPGGDPANPEWVREKIKKETVLLFAQLSSMLAETLKLVGIFQPIEDILQKSKVTEEKTLTLMKSVFEK